jgi:hypothetical protein
MNFLLNIAIASMVIGVAGLIAAVVYAYYPRLVADKTDERSAT